MSNKQQLTKKTNLLDLQYKKLNKIIHGVEIYNPDKQLRNEIQKEFLTRFMESVKDGEDGQSIASLEIGTGEMLVTFLPLLTSIEFPTDNVLLINEILAEPSMELEDIMTEVSVILSKIAKSSMDILKNSIESMTEVMADEKMSDEQKENYVKMMIAKTEEMEGK